MASIRGIMGSMPRSRKIAIALGLLFLLIMEAIMFYSPGLTGFIIMDSEMDRSGITFTTVSRGDTDWSNPGNAASSDDSYATVNPSSESYYLIAQNFSFNISSSANITGISVDIEKSCDRASHGLDSDLRLVKNGAITGSNHADTVNYWSTTDTYTSYGGPADLWGASWTPSDINNGSFGIAFTVAAGCTFSVDHIRISVYYNTTGGDGPFNPTYAYSDGGGEQDFQPFDAIYASDDSYASADLNPTAPESTGNVMAEYFGFNINENATITGVKVFVEKKEDISNGISPIRDKNVKLVINDALQGTDKASTSEWPLSDQVIIYGGSNDTWGLNLTPADINSEYFGAAISAIADYDGDPTPTTAMIDNIRISVYYTLPPIADYMPNYTRFNGSTTNFSALNQSTFGNLSNVTLEVADYGKIKWNNPVNVKNADFDSYVTIQRNSICINASGLNSTMNSSANLTLYAIHYTNPIILKDRIFCSDCTILVYKNSNLTFRVQGFSNYTTAENTSLSIWDSNDAGYYGGGNDFRVLDMITFYANYSNQSSKAPITNATCSIRISQNWSQSSSMTYNSTIRFYIYNITFNSPANYTYNISCNRTDFISMNLTGNISMPLNMTIAFVSPTDTDGTIKTTNSEYVNVSINGSHIGTAFIDWNRSLIGWWRFNNEAGENSTLIRDWSTYGYNATCSLSTCPHLNSSGMFGSSSSYDGGMSTTYYTVPNITNQQILNSYTLEAWIRTTFDNFEDTRGPIIDYPYFDNPDMAMIILQDNKIHCINYNNATISTSTVIDGVWHHVACTFNGTILKVYIDGTLENSNTADLGYTPDILYIGLETSDGYSFDGSIDEARVWKRALSAQEINASYNASRGLYRNYTPLTDGNYSYAAYLQDFGGNIISTGNRTVLVDTVAPVTTDNATGSCMASNFSVRLTATDATSGVNFTDYCIDTSGSCSPSTNGTLLNVTCVSQQYCQQYVRYFSHDFAGNIEITKTSSLTQIDGLGPYASENLTPENDTYTNINNPMLEWAKRSDIGCSATAHYSIKVYNDSNCTSVNQSIIVNDTYYVPSLLNDSIYTWNVRAADALWNYGNLSSCQMLTIDTLNPLIEFISPTDVNNTYINFLEGRNSTYININSSDLNQLSGFIDWNYTLSGWWTFSDDSNTKGGVVHDNSAYSNTFQCIEKVTCPRYSLYGARGSSYFFDGASDYLEGYSSESLNFSDGDTITIVAWIYPESFDGTQPIISKSMYDGTQHIEFAAVILSGKIAFYYGEGAPSVYIGPAVTLDRWTRIAITYEFGVGNSLAMYLDGEPAAGIWAEGDGNETVPSEKSDYVLIGASNFTGTMNYLEGGLDDVLVFKRTLSASEIKSEYDIKASQLFRNFTNLADGAYHYLAYAQDAAGNIASTELRKLTMDTESPVVGLSMPSNGTRSLTDNISFECNITDNIGLSNVTLYVWNASADIVYQNTSYSGGLSASASWNLTLPHKGDFVWNCLVYDLAGNPSWAPNNWSLRYLNIPDQVILKNPSNGNTTIHDRNPLFEWYHVNFSLWYDINITSNYCPGIYDNSSETNYTPGSELCVKSDGIGDTFYEWSARACNDDGCGVWSETWNFTIEPWVVINILNDTIDFGNVSLFESRDTTSGDPAPFFFHNDGNVAADLSNVTAAQDLWLSPGGGLGTKYFMIKARNTSEDSFNISGSAMDWVNISSENGEMISMLDYNDSHDSAFIDVSIEVPEAEPPGSKNAGLLFTWRQS